MITKKNIHVIGIGGIGASALAQILHHNKNKITGSDTTATSITTSLKRSKIPVYIGHDEKYVTPKTDLVIYSPAIPANNPELKKAKKLKIKTLSYPEALGELTKEYLTVAICGAHGKSTTTAISSILLKNAYLDPTVVIGTKVREFGNKNYRIGKSHFLVVEACEYKRSFTHLNPKILIITNVELDHPDYYKDLADFKSAFAKLAKKVPKNGIIIIDSDDPNSEDVVKDAKAHVVRLSSQLKPANFHLINGHLSYDDNEIEIKPKVIGDFNVHNAAYAAILGALLELPPRLIEKTIRDFSGTWRRMEYKKVKLTGKTIFIDDYAHHPTEIRATLSTLRAHYPKKKILCIYQPHQYNRTHHLLKDFGKAFTDVNEVIVPNIYKVRDSEADVASVSPDDLVREIKKSGVAARNGQGLQKTAEWVRTNYKKYDIVLTMGAGDVDGVYSQFD